MAYTPTEWHNGVTPINESNLNKIENGISTNAEDITSLLSDMKFSGTISSSNFPPENLVVGNVYQATDNNILSNNKIGDLFICTAIEPVPQWSIIPSGPRGTGTVTRVQAGDGISIDNGVITGAGTVSLDQSYTAIGASSGNGRNGLLSAIQKDTLDQLKSVSTSGSFSDLINVPSSALRPIEINDVYNIPSSRDPKDTVVSQGAIITALEEKSDVSHTHLLDDVTDLRQWLATTDGQVDGNLIKAASNTHTHGYITRDGKLDPNADRIPQDRLPEAFLAIDSSNTIKATTTINSLAVKGAIFGDGTHTYDLNDMTNNITTIKGILKPTNSDQMMSKAAKEYHEHRVFGGEYIDGYYKLIDGKFYTDSLYSTEIKGIINNIYRDITLAPEEYKYYIFTGEFELLESDNDEEVDVLQVPGLVPGFNVELTEEEEASDYILTGSGEWIKGVNIETQRDCINLIYPVGSYYETSLPPTNPNNTQSSTQGLGETWFDPNVAWGEYSTWVLETEGLVHVSSSPASTAYPGPTVANDQSSGANNAKVVKKDSSGVPVSPEEILTPAWAGVKNGGEETHKLTAAEAAQKAVSGNTSSDGSHYHGMYNIWSNGGGGSEAYKFDTKRKLQTRYTELAGAHTHTVSITGSDATNAHENRQPYINVYRWHRLPNPQDDSQQNNG